MLRLSCRGHHRPRARRRRSRPQGRLSDAGVLGRQGRHAQIVRHCRGMAEALRARVHGDAARRSLLRRSIPTGNGAYPRRLSQGLSVEVTLMRRRGKVAGRGRCHEEATRTTPVPAEPHGPRRCGGPEHSVGLSNVPPSSQLSRGPAGKVCACRADAVRRLPQRLRKSTAKISPKMSEARPGSIHGTDTLSGASPAPPKRLQPAAGAAQAASGTTRLRPSRLAR